MGRIKYVLLSLLVFTSLQLLASEDSTLHLQLIKKMQGNYINFWTDNLNNYYLQTSTNHLIKTNSNGDSIASFNDVKRYGNIYSIDVTNPLKILIYYKDFATIVVADRFLSKINTIDLRKVNIYQCKSVALSYDNNIWVFDALDSKLKKVGENGNVIFESTDFRSLFPEVPDISQIIDNNGQLYLYDAKTGWYIFDYYGALKTRTPFTNWQDVSVEDNVMKGRQDATFYSYYPAQLKLDSTVTDLPSSIKVIQKNKFSYVLTSGGISVYNAEKK